MPTPPVVFDAAQNVALLGGAPVVFHCHYYNCALQEAVERGLGPEDALAIQRLAAQEAVRPQLARVCAGMPASETYATASQIFSSLGFGTLDLSGVTARGGDAIIPHSHYALGWMATRGERTTPVCAFYAGYVAAAVVVAHNLPTERVQASEVRCYAAGADRCVIRVEVL